MFTLLDGPLAIYLLELMEMGSFVVSLRPSHTLDLFKQICFSHFYLLPSPIYDLRSVALWKKIGNMDNQKVCAAGRFISAKESNWINMTILLLIF